MKVVEAAFQARVEARIRKDERIKVGKALLKFYRENLLDLSFLAALESILENLSQRGTGK